MPGMALEKPHLFETGREFLLFLALCGVLLLAHLGWKYADYRDFVSKPFYYTYVNVYHAYTKEKKGHRYQVMKVEDDEGRHFYTTTHRKTLLEGKRLRLALFPDKRIGFFDYMGTFYVKSRVKKVLTPDITFKERLYHLIEKQHKTPQIQALYKAIFFASPLPPAIREQIAKLGISHLVALSGFHLGILWAMLYGGLLLLYRPLQQRYFPHRFALVDLGVTVLILLGIYVWFTGAPPSLVRAFAMILLGWLAVILGVALLDFQLLFAVIALLLVFFPALMVSVGFWFSVAGVFYIYLLLRYTKMWHPLVVTLVAIPIGIFLLMLPIVHGMFSVTTPCQLVSPLLSLLFIPFYPAVMVLHLVGAGELLDVPLQWLLAFPCKNSDHLLPLWAVAGYVGLSFLAIRYRWVFYGLCMTALVYGVYLFVM
jgi:competence protein ComEC